MPSKTNRKIFALLCFYAAVLPTTLCAQSIEEFDVKWRSLRADSSAVETGTVSLDQPRKIHLSIAKIDLTAELEIVVTPSNGEKPKEAIGLTVVSFLEEHRCDVAINAGAFQPVLAIEKGNHDIAGMHVANGTVVSANDPRKPVLTFDKDNRPDIHGAKQVPDAAAVHNAVPGFHIVLKDGVVQGASRPLHPRTAAGISEDGNTLWLLVIDGRQPRISDGVTPREVGRILKTLGAYKGINLDGGGSSTLVVRDSSGEPKTLNHPINAGIPGLPRPVASHLGIRIRKP